MDHSSALAKKMKLDLNKALMSESSIQSIEKLVSAYSCVPEKHKEDIEPLWEYFNILFYAKRFEEAEKLRVIIAESNHRLAFGAQAAYHTMMKLPAIQENFPEESIEQIREALEGMINSLNQLLLLSTELVALPEMESVLSCFSAVYGVTNKFEKTRGISTQLTINLKMVSELLRKSISEVKESRGTLSQNQLGLCFQLSKMPEIIREDRDFFFSFVQDEVGKDFSPA